EPNASSASATASSLERCACAEWITHRPASSAAPSPEHRAAPSAGLTRLPRTRAARGAGLDTEYRLITISNILFLIEFITLQRFSGPRSVAAPPAGPWRRPASGVAPAPLRSPRPYPHV